MSKDYDRFNKFCEQYDMYADGTEEKVIEFLKGKFPEEYKKALEEADDGISDFPPEQSVSPSMIWGYMQNDDEFFESVENWFKETFPDEDFG
jgi:hypothetical protein